MDETIPTAERLVELFNQAKELPVGERVQFLDEACGDDPQMRAEVDSLLQAVLPQGDYLPAGPAVSPQLEAEFARLKPEEEGERIGHYKLLQEIGQGGFGTVWMADQEQPVKRRVALKIIKMGMDTKEVIARFEQERQALAMMDHPNIARVFDAGATPFGRPYFVMELVKGVPITEFCDEQQLDTRHRLELFGDVCSAINHAHQKGVIHRDIKPSNVMITLHGDKPVVKVIDFGIAKATQGKLTEKTLFTRFEQFIGTPVYMSPEQAATSGLDIDTRSDIYALGILLYELLTGKPPFDAKSLASAGYDEMRRIIREVEPPKPSSKLSTIVGEERTRLARARHVEPDKLSRLVEPDLDWIVMKAIEKDRNRRYETANGFARDIERYLADEPVQARRPSAPYRLRKFARRHKAALTASSVVIVAILLVVAGLGWMVRDRAAREERITTEQAKQRQRINDSAERAIAVSDEHLQQGNWQKSLIEARRAESVLASGFAGDHTRRRVAERLADLRMVLRLEDLRTAVPENPVGWDTAVADGTHTRLFRDYGIDVEESDAEGVGKQMRERAIHVQLALALDNWALHTDAARRKRLLAIAQVADPDEVRCQIRNAMERLDRRRLLDLAAKPEIVQHSAATVTLLASGLRAVRDTDACVQLLRRGQNHHRDDFRINFLLANLHLYHQRPPRLDDAIRFYQAALALQPKSPGVLNNLGDALIDNGQLDEAVDAFRESAALQPEWGPVHSNLGRALMARGDLDEAVHCYRRAIDLQARVKNLAPEAVAAFRQAVERRPGDAEAHCNLGIGLHAEGKHDEAVASLRKALELEPRHVHARLNLGHALRDQRKLDEALAEYDEALRLDPNAAEARLHRARLRACLGKFREAADDYGRAVEGKSADHYDWWQLVLPHAYLGDTNAYRDVSGRALARFEASDNRGVHEQISRACLLLPPPAAMDPARPAAMAARALAGKPSHPWYQLSMALAEYRLGPGHFEAAVRLIDDARPAIVHGHAELALDLLGAMTLHRMGRSAEARVALADAAGRADRKLAKLGDAPLDDGGVDMWLLVHVLQREAEELIGRVPPQELVLMRQQAWDRELATLSEQLQAKPDDPAALTRRARLHVRTARFEQAAQDFNRLVQLAPADHLHWFCGACLLAYLGREAEYRAHCQAMLEQFADTQDKFVLDRTTKAALLLPGGAGGDVERLAERARKARAMDLNEGWFNLLLGIAEFRAGRPEVAVPWLEKCRAANEAARTATAEAFLAMAHHQLARQEDATAALARCAQLIDRDLPQQPGVGDLAQGNFSIEDWLIAHTCRREAEATILAR